jgi:hypothetical protein
MEFGLSERASCLGTVSEILSLKLKRCFLITSGWKVDLGFAYFATPPAKPF